MELNRYRGDGSSPVGKKRFPYLSEPPLRDAVNIAITLERPLLVKGPPGCGKTQLAFSISHELHIPIREWYIKSTSRARDGLYTIDALRRLQDAQTSQPKAQKLVNYLSFGPLGEAIRRGEECVVLIDEIDKADIDFPNDLLRELDRKEFEIEELDEKQLTAADRKKGFQRRYISSRPPVVLITSNDEKELPDAFLRRCIFHYIDFPKDKQLREIVDINTRDLQISKTLIKHAVARLKEFRALERFRKSPATSELIDWVKVLHHWEIPPGKLAGEAGLTELPHWQILFKHRQDQLAVERAVNSRQEPS